MDVPPHPVCQRRLLLKDFVAQQINRQLPDLLPSIDSDYESLPDLIIRANVWLHAHPNYTVHTCETVDFKLENNFPRVTESIFRTRGERPNCYILGLRVWCLDTLLQKDPDEIDYFNVMPFWKTTDPDTETLLELVSEPLNDVVARLNTQLHLQSLEGRIFCVQTFSVKVSEEGPHPNRTVWKDRRYVKQLFLIGLRVFYLKGLSQSRQLSFTDLLPQTLPTENPHVRHPVVEPFPEVLRRARTVYSQLPSSDRFLNIQTLHFRQDFLQPIDINRSNFCEDNMHSYQLKFLRIWCSVDRHRLPHAELPPTVRPAHPFNCKLFCPKLLRKPGVFHRGHFETQPDLQIRLSSWLTRTNVQLAGIETVLMRVFSGAENFEGFNTMHTWNRVIHHSNAAHSHRHNFLHGRTHHRHGVRHCESSVAAETFVTVYRVYFFGELDPDLELDTADDSNERSLEEFMLDKASSSCCVVL